ncbi:hypothetical protein C0581_04545 [Candidatus Parcubacteria bacterium]|nr:MAG: hypothetical protein C0581_04545 [Candidatus Parcubacteria bacterium]
MLDRDADGNYVEFCEFTAELTGSSNLLSYTSNNGYIFNATCDTQINSDVDDHLNSLSIARRYYLDNDEIVVNQELRDKFHEILGLIQGQEIFDFGCQLGDCDLDNIGNDIDNCPNIKNEDQADGDGDGAGDVCDICPNDIGSDADVLDSDADGLCPSEDNCPNHHNPDQSDLDGDGIGDMCETDAIVENIANGVYDAILDMFEEDKDVLCREHIGYCNNNSSYVCSDDSDCVISYAAVDLDNPPENIIDFVNGFIHESEVTDNGDGQARGQCIQSISLYNKDKEYSCSYDCQDYGGYCGDNIVQWDHEECDDGNTNNVDACPNDCQLPDGAICGNSVVEAGETCDDGNNTDGDGCSQTCSIEAPSTDEAFCGDGVENQDDEKCDLGDRNGELCTPEYGDSCTYCTAGTLEVGGCREKTIDSPQYCGNGQVDYDEDGNALERCDYISDNEGNQTSVFKATGFGLQSDNWTCTDQLTLLPNLTHINEIRGKVSCENACNDLIVDNCVQCGFRKTDEGGAEPKMAVLNVITGKDGNEEWSSVTKVNGTPVLGPFTQTDMSMWKGMYARYYRLEDDPAADLEYMGSGNLDNANTQPYTEQQFVAYGNNGTLSSDDWGIETDPLCKDFYGIYFNKNTINRDVLGNEHNVSGSLDEFLRYGSYFPYDVNGELGVVKQDLIVSPAIPNGAMRVVVRWDRTENPNIKFVGNFYRAGSDDNYISYLDVSSRDDNDNEGTCDEIRFDPTGSGYWQPTNCEQTKASVHSLIEGEKYGVQAYTFYPSQNSGSYDMGFVVSSLNGPINEYNDQDIWVDVYLPRSGQDPTYSIHEPNKTFRIEQADSSDYNLARYWHVFNIVKNGNGDYIYVDSFSSDRLGEAGGTIETDLCQVMENIPTAPSCQ